MQMSRGKKFAFVVVVLLIVQVPNAFAVYEMFAVKSQSPKHSSQQPFYHDCLAAIGTSRKKAGHGQSAFCNCFTSAAIEQHIAEEDLESLLQAIEGERPGKIAVAGNPPRRAVRPDHPPHLAGFLDATLPACRARGERFAEAERQFGER